MSKTQFKALASTMLAVGGLLLAAGHAAALEIRTYTALEIGFMASSHLILGEDEVILVDAQFTRSDTWNVVDLIKASGRRLTTVYVSSPRPERYMGLAVLRNHYPDVRVVAHPATVEAIAAGAEDAVQRWRPIYLDDIPPQPLIPEPLEEDALRLDGKVIEVHRLEDAAPAISVLYIPDEKTLFVSDFAFGEVHPLVDGDPAVLAAGLTQLLEKLGAVEWVYPGWGGGGGRRLLDESLAYLTALSSALDGDDTVDRMRESYPAYKMAIFLERTVRASRRSP
jgi:glyoxylase-like metal-dependent hydrolase (beta-lactamase superfamily II)